MESRAQTNPYRGLAYLLVHAFTMISVPSVMPFFGLPWDYGVGFAVGLIALMIYKRRYARWLFWSTLYTLDLLREILFANFQIAWLVIQPKPRLDPGIIAIPLAAATALETIALASAIALTPGTIGVDLGRNEAGERVLFVHGLTVGDPDEFRRTIKENFERKILHILRGL